MAAGFICTEEGLVSPGEVFPLRATNEDSQRTVMQ